MFSVRYTGSQVNKGVKPPNPQFVDAQPKPYIQTDLFYIDSNDEKLPMGYIQSKREPYAVEYAFTKYGNLNTRLGTNMGK